MSQQLISRNPDLKRLRDDGYDVAARDGYLFVSDVPYVTAARTVERGVLVSSLELSGDVTVQPSQHDLFFTGEHPHTADGRRYTEIVAAEAVQQIAPGLQTRCHLSSKPTWRPDARYIDYHEKLTTYISLLESQAQQLDALATARTYPVVHDDEGTDSVFRYMDTASSRAGISAVTDKLRAGTVGIVGLGGTGSYILDLVAKTPIEEIHLYDADRVLQHNVFRMPGAVSEDALREGLGTKVDHLAGVYSKLRTGIVAHSEMITADNVESLTRLGFVFLSLTDGAVKRLIVQALLAHQVPFVDVGLGINLHTDENALFGQIRVTTATPEFSQHLGQPDRIPYSDGEAANEYAQNIQVAELNALNAALAVVKWKKLRGYYLDLDREHYSIYQLDGNHLINQDRPA